MWLKRLSIEFLKVIQSSNFIQRGCIKLIKSDSKYINVK